MKWVAALEISGVWTINTRVIKVVGKGKDTKHTSIVHIVTGHRTAIVHIVEGTYKYFVEKKGSTIGGGFSKVMRRLYAIISKESQC